MSKIPDILISSGRDGTKAIQFSIKANIWWEEREKLKIPKLIYKEHLSPETLDLFFPFCSSSSSQTNCYLLLLFALAIQATTLHSTRTLVYSNKSLFKQHIQAHTQTKQTHFTRTLAYSSKSFFKQHIQPHSTRNTCLLKQVLRLSNNHLILLFSSTSYTSSPLYFFFWTNLWDPWLPSLSSNKKHTTQGTLSSSLPQTITHYSRDAFFKSSLKK